VWPVGVGDEVQDGDEEEADRLGEVKQLLDGRVPEDAGRGTKIRLDDPDAARTRKSRFSRTDLATRGCSLTTSSAAARSTGKLLLPPSR
jgi:hypothetical protein